jgi:hypothetical protein
MHYEIQEALGIVLPGFGRYDFRLAELDKSWIVSVRKAQLELAPISLIFFSSCGEAKESVTTLSGKVVLWTEIED